MTFIPVVFITLAPRSTLLELHDGVVGVCETNGLEDRMNLFRVNRAGTGWARASAIRASALLIALCLELFGLSIQVSQADSNGDFQQFVGTWQAKFKGVRR